MTAHISKSAVLRATAPAFSVIVALALGGCDARAVDRFFELLALFLVIIIPLGFFVMVLLIGNLIAAVQGSGSYGWGITGLVFGSLVGAASLVTILVDRHPGPGIGFFVMIALSGVISCSILCILSALNVRKAWVLTQRWQQPPQAWQTYSSMSQHYPYPYSSPPGPGQPGGHGT